MKTYISNDCFPDLYFHKFHILRNFPLSLGTMKVKDYKQLLLNINDINFNNVDFYIKKDLPYFSYIKEPINYTVGKIDNCFEYYFAHDLERNIPLEQTVQTYYRRLSRWDGKLKNIEFHIINVLRPFEYIDANDLYDLINTPTIQKKNILISNDKYGAIPLDEANITSLNYETFYCESVFPYLYFNEIQKEYF